MEVWNKLCIEAFDGDSRADESLLFIQRCGQTQIEDSSFRVTTEGGDKQAQQEQLLRSLGFTQDSNQQLVYILPGEIWKTYEMEKRKRRMEWHEDLQKRLSASLRDCLDRIQQPLILTHGQRLALVQEFARNHAMDAGSVPFLCGLVGCLRAQLYKPKLVDWQVTEYVMTQNGKDAMLDYIRLIRGVLGLTLIFRKDGTHDYDGSGNQIVALDMTTTARAANTDTGTANTAIMSPFESVHSTLPVVNAAATDTDNDHYIIWRMNPALSDHELTEVLACLPRQQCNQSFPLSPVSRSSSSLLPSTPLLRWLAFVFRRCLSIFRVG